LIITTFVFVGVFWTLEYKDMSITWVVNRLPHVVLFISLIGIFQSKFKTYNNIWRYAQASEYLSLFAGNFLGFFIYYVIEVILGNKESLFILLSIYAISLTAMFLLRLCYRTAKEYKLCNGKKSDKAVVIIGAGKAGVHLLEVLKNNPNSSYKVAMFLDDDEAKIGKHIHNVLIKGPIKDMKSILIDESIEDVILAIPSLDKDKKKEVLEQCISLNYRIRILPGTLSVFQKKSHENPWNKLKEVSIDELLGRDQVDLEDEKVKDFLHNKVVLVTGGGGSIGAELCRQIAMMLPKQLIILDIYENNAYEIQQELLQTYKSKFDLRIEIASVRDKEKIFQIFEHYRPNIVFHAAAHKHVPLMEDCPGEAIKNNIHGTYNVVQAAHQYKADKFVLISTDKAVNPTNVMGASKRFCEMILQSMKGISQTEFVAVRFGNVLGSNGSVIPLFQKQIAAGGPVTITDKRIVRYFMTISEAAALVLCTGAMANNSEIYILDMGQPVKIIDLAKHLIKLTGHEPYTEIDIIETGLRPGEKLYEELLIESKELIATSNHKIFIEKQNEISQERISSSLERLDQSLQKDSSFIKKALKEVVPSFKEPDEINYLVGSKVDLMNYSKGDF
jgi:FlaA1/EpsC-like NDP-sugar epimerase